MKKILILAVIGSCLFCHSALAATPITGINRVKASNNSTKVIKGKYSTWMKIGYNAYDKKDYNTALINFKRALALHPNDGYAKKAIQNTEKHLAKK